MRFPMIAELRAVSWILRCRSRSFISHRNYGYAAARAYTAYQDPDFLALAVTSWTSARQYTISGEQAASGTMDGKPFNLSLSCQGGECYS